MKKLSVHDFVEGYKKCTNIEDKKEYIKSMVEVVPYVGFVKKTTIAEKIVQVTMHNDNGAISVDTSARYLFFVLNMINFWTNIEINFKSVAEEFDALAELDLDTQIFNCIPERERNEFRSILDMKVEDCITNEMSTKAFVRDQVVRFGELIGISCKPLLNKINESIQNLDEKTIEAAGNKINKFVMKLRK